MNVALDLTNYPTKKTHLSLSYFTIWSVFSLYFWWDLIAACAAASLAIGTLYGEQDT